MAAYAINEVAHRDTKDWTLNKKGRQQRKSKIRLKKYHLFQLKFLPHLYYHQELLMCYLLFLDIVSNIRGCIKATLFNSSTTGYHQKYQNKVESDPQVSLVNFTKCKVILPPTFHVCVYIIYTHLCIYHYNGMVTTMSAYQSTSYWKVTLKGKWKSWPKRTTSLHWLIALLHNHLFKLSFATAVQAGILYLHLAASTRQW